MTTESDDGEPYGADQGDHPESELVAEPETPPAPGCTWIAFELEEQDGRPLADERVTVEMPDGSRVQAVLDGLGRLEVTDVVGDGGCRLALATEAWVTPPRTYRTGSGHVIVARRRQ